MRKGLAHDRPALTRGTVLALLCAACAAAAPAQPSATVAADRPLVRSEADVLANARRVAELAEAGKAADALALADRLVAAERALVGAQPPVPSVAGASAAADSAATSGALELIALGLRVTAGQATEGQWADRAGRLFSPPVAGERVARRWAALSFGRGPTGAVLASARTQLPPAARAILCHWLLLVAAPGKDVAADQATAWFKQVVPLASEGGEGPLAVTLAINWMDHHGEADAADKLLDSWIERYSDAPAGVTALQLRSLTIAPGDDRTAFFVGYAKKFAGRAVGGAAAVPGAQDLLRTKTVTAALQALAAAGPADKDIESPADGLFALLHRLCASHFPSGLSRPAAQPMPAPDVVRTGTAELTAAIKLFHEYDEGGGADIPIAGGGAPISISPSTLVPVLQRVCAAAIEPPPAGSKKAVYKGLDPEALGARLRVFTALSPSAGLPAPALRRLLAAYLAECGPEKKSADAYQDLKADPVLAPFAHAALFQAALDRVPADTAAADKAFEAFLTAGGRLILPEHAQWGIRQALAAVEAAPPDGRADLWAARFGQLASRGFDVSDPVVAEVAGRVDLLKANPALGQRIVTDILLASRRLPQAFRLQEMRVELFAQVGDWKNALAAARINVALGLATDAGPAPAVARYASILDRAKETGRAKDAADPGRWIRKSPDALTGPSDDVASAAARALSADSLSAEDRARVEVLAGQPEQALADAYKGFLADPTPTTTAMLWVAAATAENGLIGASYATEWLARGRPAIDSMPPEGRPLLQRLATINTSASSGDPGPVARRAAGAWEPQLVAWIKTAYGDNRPEWAGVLAALDLARLQDPTEARLAIDRLVAAVPAAKPAPDTAIAMMRDAARQLPPAANLKRQLTIKVANLLYDAGADDQAKSELDSLEIAAAAPSDKQDLGVATLRALLLIRANQLGDAQRQLVAATEWPGADEDRARVQFLIGWVYLQQEKKDQAINAFAAVGEKFGQTTFAAKARDLVDQLKAN
jgi:hypothetical protein